MRPDLFFIPAAAAGRLAMMPRPRGGEWLDDEIARWHRHGVDTVVSLLDPAEVSELDLETEAARSKRHGMQFVSLPIPDRGCPACLDDATALARTLAQQVADGRTVAIHCRAGIGRSSLIAAAVLILSGVPAADALQAIAAARGTAVPDTAAQRAWVLAFARRRPRVTTPETTAPRRSEPGHHR